MTITADDFKRMTGYEPENDDLERCNCSQAGHPGHSQCGVCKKHDMPIFACVPCMTDRINRRKSHA